MAKLLTATRCSTLDCLNAEATMPTTTFARFRRSLELLSSSATRTSSRASMGGGASESPFAVLDLGDILNIPLAAVLTSCETV